MKSPDGEAKGVTWSSQNRHSIQVSFCSCTFTPIFNSVRAELFLGSALSFHPLCSLSKFSFPCSETHISQHPQPRLTQSCYLSYYEIKSHPKGLSSSSYHQTCELHSSDVIPDFSQLPSFRWFLLSCVISPPHSGIIPAGIQTHTLCKRKSSSPRFPLCSCRLFSASPAVKLP